MAKKAKAKTTKATVKKASSNGSTGTESQATPKTQGNGEPAANIIESLESDERVGDTLRTLEAAIHRGWEIPDAAKKVIPDGLLKVFEKSKKIRHRILAANVLRLMLKDNIDAMQVIDRLQRLQMGLATENVDHHLTADIRIEMRSAKGNHEMAALMVRMAEIQSGIDAPAAVGGNGSNGNNGSSKGNGHA